MRIAGAGDVRVEVVTHDEDDVGFLLGGSCSDLKKKRAEREEEGGGVDGGCWRGNGDKGRV